MTKDIDKYFEEQGEEKAWIPTKLVAERFGVHPQTIIDHKNNHSELIAGQDYILSRMFVDGQNRKVLLWSNSGTNKLSKIIQTDEAKEHRKQTLIPIDTIYQTLMALQPHIELIPEHEDRITILESNLCSPIEYSKLLSRFSKKRFELFRKGYPWYEVHETSKGWTGLSKYTDINIGQIEEGIRRIDELLGEN